MVKVFLHHPSCISCPANVFRSNTKESDGVWNRNRGSGEAEMVKLETADCIAPNLEIQTTTIFLYISFYRNIFDMCCGGVYVEVFLVEIWVIFGHSLGNFSDKLRQHCIVGWLVNNNYVVP